MVHDSTSILNFDEHHFVIPITVLEELDSLKSGRPSIAADCQQAIRELDKQLGQARPKKVVCLGDLAQIDTPYLTFISSGLTYLTERLKRFPHGGNVRLQGVPPSNLAAFAEEHL